MDRILFIGGPLHGQLRQPPMVSDEDAKRIPRANLTVAEVHSYQRREVVFSLWGGPMRSAWVMEYVPPEGERMIEASNYVVDLLFALGVGEP